MAPTKNNGSVGNEFVRLTESVLASQPADMSSRALQVVRLFPVRCQAKDNK